MSDDIELLIDDPNDIAVEAPKGEEKKAPAVDDGIAALKAQLNQKDRQIQQVEQRAAQAENAAVQAQQYAGHTQHQSIVGALTANTDRLVSIKEELKNAAAIGDAERIADLTEAMSDVKLNIRQLEDGKRELERRLQQPRQPQRQEADDDEMSPAAKAWLANNKECQTDPKKYRAMIAGHTDAIARDIEPDTPEYFAHIEARVYGQPKTQTADRGRVADNDVQERPQARYAAPVERDAGPRKVQLRITPEMREAAAMSDMSIEEYAKEYVKLHGVR